MKLFAPLLDSLVPLLFTLFILASVGTLAWVTITERLNYSGTDIQRLDRIETILRGAQPAEAK